MRILACVIAILFIGGCSAPKLSDATTLEEVRTLDDLLVLAEAEIVELRASITSLQVRVTELEGARPKAVKRKSVRKASRRRPLCSLLGI